MWPPSLLSSVLYSWHRVASPFANPPSQFRFGRPDAVHPPKESSKSIPSRKSRRILSSYSPGSDSPTKHNKFPTIFLPLLFCSVAHLNPRLRDDPVSLYGRKDHNTTARGPILPTHNLQFHILFPSRLTRGLDKLVLPLLLANHPSGHALIYFWFFPIMFGTKETLQFMLTLLFSYETDSFQHMHEVCHFPYMWSEHGMRNVKSFSELNFLYYCACTLLYR